MLNVQGKEEKMYKFFNLMYHYASYPWRKEGKEVITAMKNNVSRELMDIMRTEYEKRKDLFPHLTFCYAPETVEKIIRVLPVVLAMLISLPISFNFAFLMLLIIDASFSTRKVSDGYVEPNSQLIYVKRKYDSDIDLLHECIHITAYGYKNGFLVTGFNINKKWKAFNEAVTEYITYFIGYQIPPRYIHSGYKAPYQRIHDFVKTIGTEKFMNMYFSNDCETIEQWVIKYSEKYSLNDFLDAFTSYEKKMTFASDIINKCMYDIEEGLKNE